MQKMNWHILGVGAIGSLWMARLMDCGAAVTLLVKDEEAAAHIRKHGIVLESLKTKADARVFKPRCVAVSELASVDCLKRQADIDNLLITTKAQRTIEAFMPTIPLLGQSSNMLLLQNGMGNLEQLMQLHPSDRWFVGTTTDGAYRKSKRHIVHAGIGGTQIGSPLQPCSDAGRQSLVKLMSLLEADVEWVDDIEPIIWRKLIINSAINPLAVILNCNNGALASDAMAREKISALCLELEQLSFVRKQQWTASAMEKMILSVIEKTADNVCSSLQDIRDGRLTEVDSINGYLAQLALSESVLMPVNDELLSLVKTKQESISV